MTGFQQMIVSVDFVSRSNATSLVAAGNIAVISIKGPLDIPPRLAAFGRILQIEFQDVRSPDDVWAFDITHATAVMDFVASLHAEPNEYHCIVHCKAGVSRSAAIALYVAAATGCSFSRRDLANGANPLVLKILGESSGLTISI